MKPHFARLIATKSLPWKGAPPWRTYDPSDVVPDGQLVSLSLLPAEVVTQIKGQPEEEGVIHQLEAGIGQRVLQEKHSNVSETHSIA